MKQVIEKITSIRYIWLLFLAAFICFTLYGRSNIDIFSVQYEGDSFYTRYKKDYTYDDTNPYSYDGYSDDSIKVITLRKGAINLNNGTYDFGFLYYNADADTVLKIYSSDYISSDNSGGKILFYQKLDPEQNYISGVLETEQDLNSVYIVVETKSNDFYAGYIKIESWGAVYKDSAFYCIISLFIAVVLCFIVNLAGKNKNYVDFYTNKITYQNYISGLVTIACIVTIVSSLPILYSSLPYGHDIVFHIARIKGIASGLRTGQFPVRMHSLTLNGFGYPNSYFYPELLMYIPGFLNFAGVGLITSYKFYIVFVNFITFFLAFIPFKKMYKDWYIALALATAFVLNPYRLVCGYFRAAIGEFTAFTFLPLIFYGLYAMILGEEKDWTYLVVGTTGLIQSHILSTELVGLICGIICLLFIKEILSSISRFIKFIYAGMFIILLNAWFVVPMLLMSISIRPAVYSRIQSPFGYTKYDLRLLFSTFNVEQIGPHTLGWTTLISLIIYISYRSFVKSDFSSNKFFDYITALTVFLAFGTTSFFPWEKLAKIPVLGKMLDTIQFPYRLSTIIAVFGIIICGYILKNIISETSVKKFLPVIIMLISVINACFFMESNIYSDTTYPDKNYYVSNLNNSLSVGQYEYLASMADIDDIVNESPVIKSNNSTLTVSNYQKYGTTLSFDYNINLSDGDTIIMPLTYIPKYKISVNGVQVNPEKTDKARVAFTVTEPSGTVKVHYQEPTVFRIIEIISIIALVLFIKIRKIEELSDDFIINKLLKKNIN